MFTKNLNLKGEKMEEGVVTGDNQKIVSVFNLNSIEYQFDNGQFY